MKQAPTMEDVARAADCSRSAVSLALHGDPSIPEKTRKRICDAAQKLGYRINPLVATLMRQRRHKESAIKGKTVIGYLSSHPANDDWRSRTSFSAMYSGILEAAEQLGYQVDEFNLAAPRMTPTRMQQILRARNIHSLIVGPLPNGPTTLDFDFSTFATVGLGLSMHTPIIERVANDHAQSAQLAVKRCEELGYQRIGLVLCDKTSERLDHRWLSGYLLGKNLYVPHSAHVRPLMPHDEAEIIGLLPQWISEQRPDVIIMATTNDEILLAVPNTIGVVSLSVEHPDDATSGIFQNYSLLGRVTVEHAVSKLHTNSFGLLKEGHVHLVAGQWVTGTTAPGPGRKRPI